MVITEGQVGSVAVLALSGKLTSDDSGVLTDKVSRLVNAGLTSIVLNLGELTHMDSGGLGQIISCRAIASDKGGIKLANLGRRIQDSLVMTKLIMVFDVYDSEQEAVASCEQSARERRIA